MRSVKRTRPAFRSQGSLALGQARAEWAAARPGVALQEGESPRPWSTSARCPHGEQAQRGCGMAGITQPEDGQKVDSNPELSDLKSSSLARYPLLAHFLGLRSLLGV